MAPLECIIVLIVTKLVGADVYSNIQAGAGYSSDKQQIVTQRCYNATVSSVSEQEGFAQLGTAQSSSELENVLGVSVSASGSYEAFSADAKANYMRSIEEKDYSISLNYYQYARNKVTVQLLGHGKKALIKSFRSYYHGDNYKYFGLICGDYYIASYRQGALLTMGLKIEFNSSSVKTEFMEEVGATFGDIVSAAQSVKSALTKKNIKGSVTMHAFQVGGEPSQLGNILSSSDSSEYYALACSLTTMDKCIRAAGGLLDYAKNKFSNQFSTLNNTGMTPLGFAFTELTPITYVGLNSPPSLVTPEVKQCRNALFSKLMENEYYQQKLYPFLHKGYPADLDDGFLKKASSVLSKADRNVKILMQAHGGAADCFNFPDQCESIKAKIDSELQYITADDLKFLEPVKYTLTTKYGMFYRGIDDTGATLWRFVPDKKLETNEIKREMHVHYVKATEEGYSYHITISFQFYNNYIYYNPFYSTFVMATQSTYTYDGKPTVISPDGTITYSGVLERAFPKKLTENNHKEYRRISPFFFDVYHSTESSLSN